MKTSSPRYVFNEAIQITPAKDSTSIAMVLCELPAGEGKSIRFVAPAELLDLLRFFDDARSVAEVSAAYAEQSTSYTVEKLERLISTFCLPKRVLLDPSRTDSQPVTGPAPQGYLSFRLPVLPNRVVSPIVRRLGPLFSRPVAMVICFGVIIAHLKFYFASGLQPDLVLAGGRDLTAAMLLSILAAACHELGLQQPSLDMEGVGQKSDWVCICTCRFSTPTYRMPGGSTDLKESPWIWAVSTFRPSSPPSPSFSFSPHMPPYGVTRCS